MIWVCHWWAHRHGNGTPWGAYQVWLLAPSKACAHICPRLVLVKWPPLLVLTPPCNSKPPLTQRMKKRQLQIRLAQISVLQMRKQSLKMPK